MWSCKPQNTIDIFLSSNDTTNEKSISDECEDGGGGHLASSDLRVHIPRNTKISINDEESARSITYYYDYVFNYSYDDNGSRVIHTPWFHQKS
jgi:hypothetical protein